MFWSEHFTDFGNTVGHVTTPSESLININCQNNLTFVLAHLTHVTKFRFIFALSIDDLTCHRVDKHLFEPFYTSSSYTL